MDIAIISIPRLALAFVPVAVVVFLMWRWHLINSFFAVGLISLPGMMTGQILSGVSPSIAVRYQIMVMCMIFGAAGLLTVCFLMLARRTAHFKTAQ